MTPPPLFVMDYVGPAIGAAGFVVAMSFVPEPTRRTLNTILVAGTCGVYLSGGFGPWELLYPALATPVIFRGLQSHRYIGLAWLMHAAWDLPHHLWGNPIWPFMPTSSWGCFVFDTLIAVWFLAGAPSLMAFRDGSERLPHQGRPESLNVSLLSNAVAFTHRSRSGHRA